jgi:DNA polymerase-3 subunit epsilon
MGQRSQMTAEALRALYTDRRYPDRIAAGWQQFGRLSLADLHAQQIRWYREQTVGLGQHWQQKYNEALHAAEVAHEQDADETATIAEQEAAELAARIDSLSPHWPIRPYIEQGVDSS